MASPMEKITVKDRKCILTHEESSGDESIIARERRVKGPAESIVRRARGERAPSRTGMRCFHAPSESMGPRPGVTREEGGCCGAHKKTSVEPEKEAPSHAGRTHTR
jgi:hypothetical protein